MIIYYKNSSEIKRNMTEILKKDATVNNNNNNNDDVRIMIKK